MFTGVGSQWTFLVGLILRLSPNDCWDCNSLTTTRVEISIASVPNWTQRTLWTAATWHVATWHIAKSPSPTPIVFRFPGSSNLKVGRWPSVDFDTFNQPVPSFTRNLWFLPFLLFSSFLFYFCYLRRGNLNSSLLLNLSTSLSRSVCISLLCMFQSLLLSAVDLLRYRLLCGSLHHQFCFFNLRDTMSICLSVSLSVCLSVCACCCQLFIFVAMVLSSNSLISDWTVFLRTTFLTVVSTFDWCRGIAKTWNSDRTFQCMQSICGCCHRSWEGHNMLVSQLTCSIALSRFLLHLRLCFIVRLIIWRQVDWN